MQAADAEAANAGHSSRGCSNQSRHQPTSSSPVPPPFIPSATLCPVPACSLRIPCYTILYCVVAAYNRVVLSHGPRAPLLATGARAAFAACHTRACTDLQDSAVLPNIASCLRSWPGHVEHIVILCDPEVMTYTDQFVPSAQNLGLCGFLHPGLGLI